MANQTMKYVGVVVVILVVLVGIFYLTQNNTGTTQTSTVQQSSTQGYTTVAPTTTLRSASYPVQLTDPAKVPAQTSALVMSYSAVKLHPAGASASTWLTAQGSGSVNLLNLSGKATTVAVASTTTNVSFDTAQFVVSSVTATINGVTYNVQVPAGTVNATVTGSANTSTSGGVLVQFLPTVVAKAKTNASAQTTYQMNLSAKAVVVSKADASTTGALTIGNTAALTTAENASLTAAIIVNINFNGGVTVINNNIIGSTGAKLSNGGLVHNENASGFGKGNTSGYVNGNSTTFAHGNVTRRVR